MESNIPKMKRGINMVVPKYISRRSQPLRKIKTEAITKISSQNIWYCSFIEKRNPRIYYKYYDLEGFKSRLQEPPVGLHFQGHPTGKKRFGSRWRDYEVWLKSPQEKTAKFLIYFIVIFFIRIKLLMIVIYLSKIKILVTKSLRLISSKWTIPLNETWWMEGKKVEAYLWNII